MRSRGRDDVGRVRVVTRRGTGDTDTAVAAVGSTDGGAGAPLETTLIQVLPPPPVVDGGVNEREISYGSQLNEQYTDIVILYILNAYAKKLIARKMNCERSHRCPQRTKKPLRRYRFLNFFRNFFHCFYYPVMAFSSIFSRKTYAKLRNATFARKKSRARAHEHTLVQFAVWLRAWKRDRNTQAAVCRAYLTTIYNMYL